jgi:hypothetical protein
MREKILTIPLALVIAILVCVALQLFLEKPIIPIPQIKSGVDPCANFTGEELSLCKAKVDAERGNFDMVRRFCEEEINTPALKEECFKLIPK